MKDKLKLFVWENVLTEYTTGLAVTLAHDEGEAWTELCKADELACWVLQGEPEDRKIKTIKEIENNPKDIVRPKIITKPKAFTGGIDAI